MEHLYRQIGWGMWLSNEDYFIGHPDRLESLNIFYSEKSENKFAGLGIDEMGIFEFGGRINQEEINFAKIYRKNSDTRAIKGKINYYGKRFSEGEPAGYRGEWKEGKKSGLFTFIAGDLEKTETSSLDLTQLTMLEITRRKLEKLNGKFKNHLKEMPFAP